MFTGLNAVCPTLAAGPAAATGVAIINSVANLGGLIGPMLVGELLCQSAAEGVCPLAQWILMPMLPDVALLLNR